MNFFFMEEIGGAKFFLWLILVIMGGSAVVIIIYLRDALRIMLHQVVHFAKVVESTTSIDEFMKWARTSWGKKRILKKMFVTAMSDYQRIAVDPHHPWGDNWVDYLSRPLYVLWGKEQERMMRPLFLLQWISFAAPLLAASGFLTLLVFDSFEQQHQWTWLWLIMGTALWVTSIAGLGFLWLRHLLQRIDKKCNLAIERLCIILARDLSDNNAGASR